MSKDREVVAKRYAVALFDLAKEKGNIDLIEEELFLIKEVLENNKELVSVLKHPKVSIENKKNLFKESMTGKISDSVLNTIYILIDRHRESSIPPLAEQFVLLANEERGIADAIVYSVKSLSESEKNALAETFAKKLGKHTLRIENKIDSNLVGGVKLVIGNKVFDGSVSSKLKRIERQLVSS